MISSHWANNQDMVTLNEQGQSPWGYTSPFEGIQLAYPRQS